MHDPAPLRSGARVVVVGGGPAGVACALALNSLAQARGLRLAISIYEGKIFANDTHYNQCVGVLSPPIVDLLETQLGVPFPFDLVERTISGHVLHADETSIQLDGPVEPCYAVRRITFDHYLLAQAATAGIQVVHSRVTDLDFDPSGVTVYSESKNAHADIVVGAFGLDDGTAKLFERTTRYRQPQFLTSIVTNVRPGQQFMSQFGNRIHAFLPCLEKIEFGAVTPKRNHLTINVGGAEVTSERMDRFLASKPLRTALGDGIDLRRERIEYFKGRFPISPAKEFYGDRYVIVGDAAGLVRPFKGKGVNAAIISGLEAARTMVEVGISRRALHHYYQSQREVIRDLPYGQAIRMLAIAGTKYKLMDPIIRLAQSDNTLRTALFYCVSADKLYRDIIRNAWDLRLLGELARDFSRDLALRVRHRTGVPLRSLARKQLTPRREPRPAEA